MSLVSRTWLGSILPSLFGFTFAATWVGWTGTAASITIRIDYSKDADGFFGAKNPQGPSGAAQARAAVEAVAAYYSEILEDTFSTFEIPEVFNGSRGGQVRWFWKQRITNPTTGLNEAEVNALPPNPNEFVVFVGARDLPGDAIGLAGPGGFVGGFASPSGDFTAAENTQIDQMEAAFLNGTKRGQASGFSSWGGSAAFDDTVTWHFNHTTNPPPNTTPNDPSDDVHDFYSVARHEFGHVLGLGTSTAWDDLVTKKTADNEALFKGTNAVAVYGSSDLKLESLEETGHWNLGVAASPIYKGAGTQTPIMVPKLAAGTRYQLTNLDAAALADIGWEIDLPGANASAATLASIDLSSGSSSIAALSASITPEPGSCMLAMMAGSMLALRRKRS